MSFEKVLLSETDLFTLQEGSECFFPTPPINDYTFFPPSLSLQCRQNYSSEGKEKKEEGERGSSPSFLSLSLHKYEGLILVERERGIAFLQTLVPPFSP